VLERVAQLMALRSGNTVRKWVSMLDYKSLLPKWFLVSGQSRFYGLDKLGP
jgi:hypothetical protein